MHRKAVSRSLSTLLLVLLGSGTQANPIGADDWPGWRGPHQDGTTTADGALHGVGERGLRVLWKREIGSGYSSVSVAGGRAVTQFSAAGSDVVAAFDASTGKELWRVRIADTYAGVDGAHDGPRSTPFIDRDRVVAVGPEGHLLMLDASDGRVIWAKHLVDDLGGKPPSYGVSASPTVVEDVVVVATGNEKGGFSGLDRRDGRVLWSFGEARVDYHSPVRAQLLGRLQVVAPARGRLWGLDPSSGEMLWFFEHGGRSNRSHPVVVSPAALVFDHSSREATHLRLTQEEGKVEPTAEWQGMAYSGYTAPVFHDGTLYGFRERILTALGLADGKVVWRSRSPGVGFVILVDDHLVVLTRKGTVHVAEASTDGYREAASLDALGDVSWTPPSFADGRIYVRGLSGLAAVEVTGSGQAVAQVQPTAEKVPSMETSGDGLAPPGSKLAAFLDRVEGADDKKAVVDSFMAEQKSFPVIEGDEWAHVIYRGPAQQVGLWRDMFLLAPWHYIREERPLNRVDGTDLFYYSLRLPRNARLEYQLAVDFENQVDALNPMQEEGRSVLTMPGFVAADHLDRSEDARAGRLDSFELESKVLESGRKIDVYLPAGYDESEKPLPVIYAGIANEMMEKGKVLSAVDRAIAEGALPFVTVLIHPPERSSPAFISGREPYIDMLVDELIPHIEAKYRVRTDAAHRGLLGTRDGLVPLWTAFTRPGAFGRIAVRSAYLEPEDAAAIRGMAAQSKTETDFYIAYGHYDWRSDEANFDAPEEHRQIAATLEQSGHRVVLRDFNEGMRWGSWRHHLKDMLKFLVGTEAD